MRFSLVAVLSGFLLWATAATSQSTVNSPALQPEPHKLLTSDLISWTQTQSPKPIDDSAQAKAQKPSSDSAGALDVQQTEPSLQTFTGTITREGTSYVLRTSDKWFYDLDDQSEAEQYLNQRVAVTGRLNQSGDLIHVHLIQPVS